MNWKKYKEEKPPEGEEVLAYHPSWIDEDFNPRGIRIGFWNGGDDFKSAHWWDYQDCYITISHCDCDDNSLFSDRIKNSIEPELWISLDVITNYLPDIKQERSYNNDLVGIFERYKDIADGDMEVAMNFIKEAYPFNEETESFIRKKFDMPIPGESKEQ